MVDGRLSGFFRGVIAAVQSANQASRRVAKKPGTIQRTGREVRVFAALNPSRPE